MTQKVEKVQNVLAVALTRIERKRLDTKVLFSTNRVALAFFFILFLRSARKFLYKGDVRRVTHRENIETPLQDKLVRGTHTHT